MTAESAKVLSKATINAANALGLDKQELATVIGISVDQLDSLHRNESLFLPRTETGQRCMLLIRLLAALTSQVGDNTGYVHQWLRSHNSAIGEIPLAALSSHAGLINVVAYLEAAPEGR
jgi:hypothetical protein